MKPFASWPLAWRSCAMLVVAWAQRHAQSAYPKPAPRRDRVGDPPGHDDVSSATPALVRPTGEVLPKGRWSVSGYRDQLGSHGGIHRHLGLPRHIRLRRDGSRRNLRQRRSAAAHRRRPAARYASAAAPWMTRISSRAGRPASATFVVGAQVQHVAHRGASRARRWPSAAASSCRQPTTTKGWARASSTSSPTPSSAANSARASSCQATAAS